MAGRREKVYKKLLSKKVVTTDEIVEAAEEVIGQKNRAYINSKYIRKLLDDGKLERIRRGLYSVIPLTDKKKKYVPDRFLVGSKLRKRYYLGYHSALGFHGYAYSHFNEVEVAIRKRDRFEPFQYKRLEFRPVIVQDLELGIEEKRYLSNKIRVSSKERTFVDCIDRPKYAGGWEECLKSLQRINGLDFDFLIDILEYFEKDYLWRKAGFVLSLLRYHSLFYENISDQDLNRIREKIGKSPMYLTEAEAHYYEKKWRLYVPEDFEDNLRGV